MESGFMPLELPPVGEQNGIACIFDDFFTKEQQSKEAAEVVFDQIYLMKKPSSPARSVANSAPMTRPTPQPRSC